MKIFPSVSVLFITFLSFFAQGQFKPIYWNYDISHGLPTNNLYHILVDHNDKIWFGSDYGVTCFDGIQFKTFTTEDGLLDNTVIRCYEDSLHRIWFQHVNQAPSYFYKGEIHQLKPSQDLLFSSTATLFTEISKGRLIYSGDNEFSSGIMEILPNLTYKLHTRTIKNEGAVVGYKNDVLYYSTENKGEFLDLTTAPICSNNECYNWAKIGVGDKALARPLQFIENQDSILIQKYRIKRTYHIYKKNNQKFIASSNGLYCFKKSGKNWLLDWHLFSGKTIVSVNTDHKGNVWATSINDGLFFVPKLQYSTISLSNNQRFIQSDTYKSKIYVVGENLKFSRIENNKIQPLPIRQPFVVDPSLSTPTYLFNTKGLVCRRNSECFISKNYTDWEKIQPYKADVGHTHVYQKNDSAKFIYYFGFNGLSVLNIHSSDLKIETITNKIGRIKCLAEHNDKLYIGTQKGIYLRYKKNIQRFKSNLFGNSKITGLVLMDEYLFIATGDKGVWIYNTSNQYLFRAAGPILSKVIKGIYTDNNQSIWVHTNFGLQEFFVDGSKLRENRILDLKTLLKVNDILQLYTLNDTLKILTDKTFFSIPLNQKFKRYQVKLNLDAFFVNGKRQNYRNDLELQNDESDLSFDLSFVNHTAHPVFFYYRINKGKWVLNNSSNFNFSSLSHGFYKIDFKAESPFLKTAYLPNFKIEIQKTWWQSTYFILSVFVLSIFSVGMLVKWRITKKQEVKRRSLSNELFSLQSQMNPHFTFNSLNSVQSYLSTNDKRAAQIYLADFAQLMRKIMDQAKLNLISLEEEVNFLQQYIQLEQRRLDNSFQFEIFIDPSISPSDSFLPTLMLQPFVENAIWHGVASASNAGEIHIRFTRENELLVCEITDNGPGLNQNKAQRPFHKSAGINNVRERMRLFEELFNKKIELEIINLTQNNLTGVRVQLKVPKLTLKNKLND